MGGESEQPGLRERKKQETRARLIDAAIELVDKQGYERTTVGQIAEAVDVSPRTVAHYFPSKDRLLLAVIEKYTDATVVQLTRVPDDVDPLRALLLANLTLLKFAAEEQPPKTAQHLVSLLRTIHNAPPLQPLAQTARSPALFVEVARRLGTDTDHRRVELVVAVWAAIVNVSWSGVTDLWTEQNAGVEMLPALLHDRMIETFAEFEALTSGLVGPGR
jgi:AcrR family transcriptional regulator